MKFLISLSVLFISASIANDVVNKQQGIFIEKAQQLEIKKIRDNLGILDKKPMYLIQQGDVLLPAGSASFEDGKIRPQIINTDYLSVEIKSLRKENSKLKRIIEIQKKIIKKLEKDSQ